MFCRDYVVSELNLGRDSEARFDQLFISLVEMLMLGRDFLS